MADEQTPAERNRAVLQAAGANVTSPNRTDFNIHRYPSDVGSETHPHYVMFFITTRSSDISSAEVRAAENLQFDYSQNNTIGKTTVASAALVAAQGTAAGVQLGARAGEGVVNTVNTVSKKTFDPQFGKALGGVAGGVAGAGAGLAIAAVIGNREQVLLRDAVALYMSGTPSTQYSAQWADQDLGLIAGLTQQMGGSTDIASGAMNLIRSGAGSTAAALLQQNTKNDLIGDIGGAASASAGVVVNPFKAQLFKSMGFRQFAYEYTFLPKNLPEYNSIKEIIKTFKKYMHPKLGKEKFIMSYPAEFTIAYYFRENPNDDLYRISNCALTNLSIDYGGGSDFTSFKSVDGSSGGIPTEINLKLQFTELEILSRERIEDENF